MQNNHVCAKQCKNCCYVISTTALLAKKFPENVRNNMELIDND